MVQNHITSTAYKAMTDETVCEGTWDQNGPCFGYIGWKMPSISTENLKAHIFNGLEYDNLQSILAVSIPS